MGRPKQLLQLDGLPLVRLVVTAASRSEAAEIIVVTGAYHDEVEEALTGLPVKCVYNNRWAEGQGTSVVCAMDHVGLNIAAVVFLLADQPLVTADVINDLITCWRNSDKTIIAPCFEGRRGNPVLFDKTRWQEALSCIQGDHGARHILSSHPEELGYVAVKNKDIFIDVDTPEDYEFLIRLEVGRFYHADD